MNAYNRHCKKNAFYLFDIYLDLRLVSVNIPRCTALKHCSIQDSPYQISTWDTLLLYEKTTTLNLHTLISFFPFYGITVYNIGKLLLVKRGCKGYIINKTRVPSFYKSICAVVITILEVN